jgi:hypothetical protein
VVSYHVFFAPICPFSHHPLPLELGCDFY